MFRAFFDALEAYAEGRSPQWPRVRRQHLAKHPYCAACGTTRFLEVHHVDPFYNNPARELDPDNLITLCGDQANCCHFVIGHLTDWHSYNPDCRLDAHTLILKIENRP